MILYEGSIIDELRTDFETGIESYLAGCLVDGVEPRKPYSGALIGKTTQIDTSIKEYWSRITICYFINSELLNSKLRRDSIRSHAFLMLFFNKTINQIVAIDE